MKRLSVLGFFGVLAGILAGCPIGWSDGNSQGGNGGGSGSGCFVPSDCPTNETCGSDNSCHSGDCTSTSCVSGYTCVVSATNGTASCQPGTGTGGTGGSSSTTTSSTSTSSTSTSSTSSTSTSSTSTSTTTPPVYCGHPADCASGFICGDAGTCVTGPCSSTNACIFGYTCGSDGACHGATNACDKDSDCASGSVCIAGLSGGGTCTTADNQCFDQSQCALNQNCVAGKCTQSCTSNTDCRDGYTCDTTRNICTGAVQTCTVTNDCNSATLVCVGGACVPRSNNGTCANSGDVWTENGCIPNQAATFNCSTDGQLGSGNGTPGTTCKGGSICLHHDCWISCDAPNQSACASQSSLNTCKPVADNGSTYNVCGTSMNLGNACGAGSAGNTTCSSGFICVDGYCK